MWKWILLLAFIAATGAEVAVLLELGGRLGVWWTLAWMVATALAGVAAIRVVGMQTVMRIHHKLRAQELPTLELLDMAVVLLAALLLIAPGFIADALGFLLLLPPARWAVKGCFCVLYGDLLPTAGPPERGGPLGEDVIEIRAEE